MNYEEIIDAVVKEYKLDAERARQCIKPSDYQEIIDEIKKTGDITQAKVILAVNDRMFEEAAKIMTDEMQQKQSVIAKIEKEYDRFLHYNIIVEKVVKYFADTNKDLDERIVQSISPSDYRDIINEVKGETIAKIKGVQTETLDFQDIETKMQQEALTKVKAKIIDGITERYNKIEEKIRKQEYELPGVQAKLNESNTKKELLRKIADSFEQERKLSKKGKKLPQQTKSPDIKISKEEGDLSKKLSDYNKILEFMNGEKGLELEEKLLKIAKGKTKEDIILQAKKTILDAIAFYQKYTHKRRSSMVFHIINFHIIPQPGGEQFIADNFSKIIQFWFKDQEPQEDLLKLIEKVANKLKVDNKLPPHGKEEESYQHILSQHEGDRNLLERLKEICSSRRLCNEFYIFIDFIYNFEKEKEEQNREKELQAEKAARKLLADEKKEAECKPKQPQLKKKKKNKSRNKNSKIVISNIINEPEAQDSKKEEVIFEDKEVKELRRELKELRELRFPDKESNEFEDKISNAIENHQQNLKMKAANIDDEKIKNLYVIKISFYLSRITWNIKCYNQQYGKTIEQTKNDFGTNRFIPNHNKLITDKLPDIALMIQGIDTNLKEAISMLDKMTHLVYKDYNQQDDEALLEIMGEENQELLGKFLNYLKALEEWHANKLCVVRECRIYSRRKNDQERADEKKALNIIKSCVDSLKFIVEIGIHEPWCILSHPKAVIHKYPEEMLQCSC